MIDDSHLAYPDFKNASYHEAAHAIIGSSYNIPVLGIRLSNEDPGNGITFFDFGEDTPLIKIIEGLEYDQSTFNNLTPEERKRALGISIKLLPTTIAGAVGSAIVLQKGDCLDVKFKDPDDQMITAASMVISAATQTPEEDVVRDGLDHVVSLLTKAPFNKILDTLANALLNSENLFLDQSEVNKIFQDENLPKQNASQK